MAEEQTSSAQLMLDGEKKRMIHPDFDRFRRFVNPRGGKVDSSRRGSFCALLVEVQKCFVENFRNLEVVVGTPRRDANADRLEASGLRGVDGSCCGRGEREMREIERPHVASTT